MPNIPSLDTSIVCVALEDVLKDAAYLDQVTQAVRQRLYLALIGRAAYDPPTLDTVDMLAKCFDSSSRLKPTLDVVPLFHSLGWPQRVPESLVDQLPNSIFILRHTHDAAQSLLSEYNAIKTENPIESINILHNNSNANQQVQNETTSPLSLTHARVIGDWKGGILQFKTVAVGGTFDRLHSGHRLLLAATSLITTQKIFVGVTSDKLLVNKKNKELLQSYQNRETAAVEYMHWINPCIEVIAGPLIDPTIPPLCATEEDFDAIVVSEETVHGAEEINCVRASLGFHPLIIVVVGLLSGVQGGPKLSSTDLRKLDAARGVELHNVE